MSDCHNSANVCYSLATCSQVTKVGIWQDTIGLTPVSWSKQTKVAARTTLPNMSREARPLIPLFSPRALLDLRLSRILGLLVPDMTSFWTFAAKSRFAQDQWTHLQNAVEELCPDADHQKGWGQAATTNLFFEESFLCIRIAFPMFPSLIFDYCNSWTINRYQ